MTHCKNPQCCASTGIDGSTTHGWGVLDVNGYWEHPCPEHGVPMTPPDDALNVLDKDDYTQEDMAKVALLLKTLKEADEFLACAALLSALCEAHKQGHKHEQAEIARLTAALDAERAASKELRRQLTNQRTANEVRNRELDALHYVWCSGGCDGGVHRYCGGEPLTEELVTEIEKQATRARQWLTAHQARYGKDGGK